LGTYDDCLLLKLILLAIAADANRVEEIINSPEINPNNPVINIRPVKISLFKLLIVNNLLVVKLIKCLR